MNPAIRRELLRRLDEFGKFAPDVRLGQLIVNLAYMAKGPTNAAIWDVEDEELLEVAKSHLQELVERQTPVGS